MSQQADEVRDLTHRAREFQSSGDIPHALTLMDQAIQVIEANGHSSIQYQLRRARMADNGRCIFTTMLPIIEPALEYYSQQDDVLAQVDMLLRLVTAEGNPNPSIQLNAAEELARTFLKAHIAAHGREFPLPPVFSIPTMMMFRLQEIVRLKRHYGYA